MATVYAIFSSSAALDEVVSRLGRDRVRVIPPRDLLSDAAGNYDGEGNDAVVPPAGPGGGVAGRLDGVDEGLPPDGERRVISGQQSGLEGLSPDERRDFDNALQSGSHVLVVRDAGPELSRELLSAGARQVAGG